MTPSRMPQNSENLFENPHGSGRVSTKRAAVSSPNGSPAKPAERENGAWEQAQVLVASPMSPTADGTVSGKRAKVTLTSMPKLDIQRGQRIGEATPLASGTASEAMSKIDELRGHCAAKFLEHGEIFGQARDRVMHLEREFVRLANVVGEIHEVVSHMAQNTKTKELGDALQQLGARTTEIENTIEKVHGSMGEELLNVKVTIDAEITNMKGKLDTAIVETLAKHEIGS